MTTAGLNVITKWSQYSFCQNIAFTKSGCSKSDKNLTDLIQALEIIFGTSFALCLAKTKYPLLLDMESFPIILN